MSMTNFDKNVNVISSLSDEPNSSDGLTADELKAKFDAAVNLIKDYINNTQNVEIDAALALKLNSSAVKDYIVEVGTSGIWTYHKWASGIAECWGQASYVNAPINALVGNKDYWEMTRIAYPSGLFAAVPIESPTLMPTYGAQWGTPAANTKDETGAYGIWSDTVQTVNLQINFHVVGSWK